MWPGSKRESSFAFGGSWPSWIWGASLQSLHASSHVPLFLFVSNCFSKFPVHFCHMETLGIQFSNYLRPGWSQFFNLLHPQGAFLLFLDKATSVGLDEHTLKRAKFNPIHIDMDGLEWKLWKLLTLNRYNQSETWSYKRKEWCHQRTVRFEIIEEGVCTLKASK